MGAVSAADLAVLLQLPVILVVDAAKQSHSIAALVAGFRDHRADIVIAGVVLNRVGSPRHEMMLREALDAINMPVFGCVGRHETLELPSRHLGLVQAREHGALDEFLDAAAGHMREGLDVEALMQLAKAEATGPIDVPEAPPLCPTRAARRGGP